MVLVAQGLPPIVIGADIIPMRDHTSLLAWQEARKGALLSSKLCRDYWQPWAASLFGQLQRSSLSVQLNIAEGYAFAGRKRGRNHLRIALGSAIETEDICRNLADLDAVPSPMLDDLRAHAQRSQQLLVGLLRRPLSRGLPGSQRDS